MKIGIDVSPLQGGSRMRGIGYTIINLLNNLTIEDKQDNSFVFYKEVVGDFDPIELINTTKLNYKVVELVPFRRYKDLPSIFRFITKLVNKIRFARYQYISGQRFSKVTDIDVFLQTDQDKGLPNKSIYSVLILYDLIPYIMDYVYKPTYRMARQNGLNIKRSLICQLEHFSYIKKINFSVNRANHMIAISEHTKSDYIRIFNIDSSKISVVPLGVDEDTKNITVAKNFTQSRPVPWGFAPQPIDLTTKRFILFIGGADPRRRLIDLVAAFNNLKARGEDIRLVLAGDSMESPDTVANHEFHEYLKNNLSYFDDIAFLGFVTDTQREWLYKHAVAFIYPSVYEGFGLPILEAMQHGTPVITYKNSSIPEVAGEAALFAKDYIDIADKIRSLLSNNSLSVKYKKLGIDRASKFSWKDTSKILFEEIKKANKIYLNEK